jgi:lysyl oxidase
MIAIGDRRSRRAFAAGFALLLLGALAPSRAAAAPQLLPNLQTLKAVDLRLDGDTKSARVLLRFSNRIANRGRGPLEIFPTQNPSDCDDNGDPSDDRSVYQRIFEDVKGDGIFERSKDTLSTEQLAGCMHFHPEHNHWHLDDFASYRLYRQATGALVRSSDKVSFCVIDVIRPFGYLAGSPSSEYYPQGGSGCDDVATEGISVGWADIYDYSLPGQWVDVTGLPTAKYCLASTADPSHQLSDSNFANNRSGTRVRLDFAARTAKRLGGTC